MPFASATNKIWQEFKQDVKGDVSDRLAKLDLILLWLLVSQLKKNNYIYYHDSFAGLIFSITDFPCESHAVHIRPLSPE